MIVVDGDDYDDFGASDSECIKTIYDVLMWGYGYSISFLADRHTEYCRL